MSTPSPPAPSSPQAGPPVSPADAARAPAAALGERAPLPAEALPPGFRLDPYEISEVVGTDGFVIAYLATDLERQQQVTIEEYLPNSIARRAGSRVEPRSATQAEAYEAGLRSFVDESLRLAGCRHPALMRVARGWRANGTAYRELPLVRGSRLRELRESMDTPPDQAALVGLIDGLTAALQTLHAEGGLHLDITPESILLLADDKPMLAGFSAARRAVVDDRTHALMGLMQPIFTPPEQIDEHDRRLGPWSDIYALAAVVRYCIEGRSFVGTGGAAMLPPLAGSVARLKERHPLLDYDRSFLSAIDAAMAPRPENRLRSAPALRSALGLPPIDGASQAASEWPLPHLPVLAEPPRKRPRPEPDPASPPAAPPPAAPSPATAGPTLAISAPTMPLVRGVPPPPMAPAIAQAAGLTPPVPSPRRAQADGWNEPPTAPTPFPRPSVDPDATTIMTPPGAGAAMPEDAKPGAAAGVHWMGSVPGPGGAGAPPPTGVPRPPTMGPLATDPPTPSDDALLAQIRADLDLAMGAVPEHPGGMGMAAPPPAPQAAHAGVLATLIGVLLMIGALGAAVWMFDEDRVVMSTLEELFGFPSAHQNAGALPPQGSPQGGAPALPTDRSRMSAEAALAAAEAALAGTAASAPAAAASDPLDLLNMVPPVSRAGSAASATAPPRDEGRVASRPSPATVAPPATGSARATPTPVPPANTSAANAPARSTTPASPTAANANTNAGASSAAPARRPAPPPTTGRTETAAASSEDRAVSSPDTPRQACEPRTQFALYRCMQQLCDTPRWREHGQCVLLRATDEVPPP